MLKVLGLFAVLALSSVAAGVQADVIPPDVDACRAQAVGGRCDDPKGGTCQSSTCVKIDYAHWQRDASSSPPGLTYDCLRCRCPGAGDAAVDYQYGATCKGHDDGCALGVGQTPRQLLALGLAAGVGLLLWRRRRR